MRIDYRNLTRCDAILMLPEWQYSNGAKHELLIATDMRLTIMFYDQL